MHLLFKVRYACRDTDHGLPFFLWSTASTLYPLDSFSLPKRQRLRRKLKYQDTLNCFCDESSCSACWLGNSGLGLLEYSRLEKQKIQLDWALPSHSKPQQDARSCSMLSAVLGLFSATRQKPTKLHVVCSGATGIWKGLKEYLHFLMEGNYLSSSVFIRYTWVLQYSI